MCELCELESLPDKKAHCSECHMSWKGKSICHCVLCHRNFENDERFLEHLTEESCIYRQEYKSETMKLANTG